MIESLIITKEFYLLYYQLLEKVPQLVAQFRPKYQTDILDE